MKRLKQMLTISEIAKAKGIAKLDFESFVAGVEYASQKKEPSQTALQEIFRDMLDEVKYWVLSGKLTVALPKTQRLNDKGEKACLYDVEFEVLPKIFASVWVYDIDLNIKFMETKIFLNLIEQEKIWSILLDYIEKIDDRFYWKDCLFSEKKEEI
jgi:hypothetical protein